MRSLGRAGSIILALAILLATIPAFGFTGDKDTPPPHVANELLEPVISTVDQATDTTTGLTSDPKPPVTTTVPVTTTLPTKPEPTVPVRPDPTIPSPTTTVPLPTTTTVPRPTPTTMPLRDLPDSPGNVVPIVLSETASSSVPDLPAPADEEFAASQLQPEPSHLSGILDFVGAMDLVSFLAAPLLALEVLLRALASAGEGLLAPLVMLALLAAALRRDQRFSGTKTP